MTSLSTTAPTNAPAIFIPSVVFCAVTPLLVAARFWSRLRTAHFVGLDDWAILVSLILCTTFNADMILAVHYGYGKHGTALTEKTRQLAMECFIISQALYKASINTCKASILLLYLRLFVQRKFRLICWLMIGFVVAFGIATTLGSIFQCQPIQRAWNKHLTGHCLDTTAFWYANAAFSILGDLLILIIPMPLVYRLNLPLNQRLSLLVVFGLGSFVIVTSVMRMTTLNTTSKSPDPTYEVGATMWTIIEINLAIICACLPMCRSHLQAFFPRLFPGNEIRHAASAKTLQYAGTSRNDWMPKSASKGPQASVIAGPDSGSEEYILQERGKVIYHEFETKPEGISKSVKVSVKYEDDHGSLTSGDRTPGTKHEPSYNVHVMV